MPTPMCPNPMNPTFMATPFFYQTFIVFKSHKKTTSNRRRTGAIRDRITRLHQLSSIFAIFSGV